MNDALMHEDELRRRLAPLTDSSPPAVAQIAIRAASIRRRRRWKRTLVITGVSVSAVALAAAGPMHLFGYDRDTSPPPICGSIHEMGSAFETRVIAPDELPDELRLSWTDPSAKAPRSALARVEEHPCASLPTLRLLDVDRDRVRRSFEIATSTAPVSDGSHESRLEIIRVGAGVRGWRSTWVPGDGFSYEVTGLGVSRAKMRELLASLDAQRGSTEVRSWRSAAKFEVTELTSVPTDGTRYTWRVSTETINSNAVASATLSVSEDPDPLLSHAYSGDRLIDLNGQTALQSVDGTITWIPSPGVLATMEGSATPAQLRHLASSVEPVSSSAVADLDG